MTLQAQPFEDEGFQTLSRLAYQEAGLVLSENKATMIKSRLRHRLKVLAIDSLAEYCSFINSECGKTELPYMISALTTNVSGFFREPHHFEYVGARLISDLLKRVKNGEQVRIWSAGCSNGQEPYSLAIFLAEHSQDFVSPNCKILGTDIDLEVLRYASRGQYNETQASGLNEERKNRFFHVDKTNGERFYCVNTEIRSMITFRQLNLHNSWPMNCQFDFIFCRNVMIYFDAKTQDMLWPRFHSVLTPHGLLFIGHSERIGSKYFDVVGATTYSKKPPELTCIS